MLKPKWFLSTILSMFCSLLLLCTLPDDPNDPTNTSVSILLQASKWKTESSFIEDTAGNCIRIGVAIYLPGNIDSIGLTITAEGKGVFDTMFRELPIANRDTLWKEIIFYTAGNKKVTFTPYSSMNLSLITATVSIIGKEFPENHQPLITVKGNTVIKPTETCSLSIEVTDIDTDQVLSAFMSGDPSGSQLQNNSYFLWTAPEDFIGTDTVIFTVIDNGLPPMSSSDTVIITVTPTPHLPQIEVLGDRSLTPLETCTLIIQVSDEDPGQELTISMSDEPIDSRLENDSLFIWAIPADFTGEAIITFTVVDNGMPPLSNSAKVTITVSEESANSAPQWDIETLTVTINDTSSYMLDLLTLCKDDDDDQIFFLLVSGTPPGDTIIQTTYSIDATSELIGEYSGRIVAADADGGTDTLEIDLSIVASTSPDTTPPTLDLVEPDKDSVTISTSTFHVDIIADDRSGIASVTATVDGTTHQLQFADGHYTAEIEGLKVNEYTQVVLTATDASPTGLTTSRSVYIKYESPVVDTKRPEIELSSPKNDSSVVNTSSTTISVEATDESGIASVTASLDITDLLVEAAAPIYSVAVNDLEENKYTVIRFIATDASSNGNRETLFVSVYYDPTAGDVDGPVLTQMSGPESGDVVSEAQVTVVDTVYDPSGIESVSWTLNNGAAQQMVPVTGKPGQYSLTATLTDAGDYTVVVTAVDNSTQKNSSTQTIEIEYVVPPEITEQPVSTSICPGEEATVSVSATGTPPLQYQWHSENGAITDANDASYVVSSLTATTTLTCVVSNGAGASATSDPCVITVNPGVSVAVTPTAPTECQGMSVTFKAEPSGGSSHQYKWYSGAPGSGTVITGATSSTYETSIAGSYYCTATSSAGCVGTSNGVTLTINTPPSISDPSGATVCEGGSTTMSVTSNGASFQWYKGTPGGTHSALSNTTSYSGVTYSTLTINNSVSSMAGSYYCIAESNDCSNTSGTANLTVRSVSTISSVTSSPESVCQGKSVDLTVNGELGDDASWHWYSGSCGGTPVGTGATITVSPSSTTRYYIRAEGGCSVPTCNYVQVTVNTLPTITLETDPFISVCPDNMMQTLAISNLGGGYSYQWYHNESPLSDGGDFWATNTYSMYFVDADDNMEGEYFCKVTNTATSCEKNSDPITVSLLIPPQIESQPENHHHAGPGMYYDTLRVSASGQAPLTYQWYKDGSRLEEDETNDINGVNTNKLAYIVVCPTMGGVYFCKVTDGNGCSTNSNDAVVSFEPSAMCP